MQHARVCQTARLISVGTSFASFALLVSETEGVA